MLKLVLLCLVYYIYCKIPATKQFLPLVYSYSKHLLQLASDYTTSIGSKIKSTKLMTKYIHWYQSKDNTTETSNYNTQNKQSQNHPYQCSTTSVLQMMNSQWSNKLKLASIHLNMII